MMQDMDVTVDLTGLTQRELLDLVAGDGQYYFGEMIAALEEAEGLADLDDDEREFREEVLLALCRERGIACIRSYIADGHKDEFTLEDLIAWCLEEYYIEEDDEESEESRAGLRQLITTDISYLLEADQLLKITETTYKLREGVGETFH